MAADSRGHDSEADAPHPQSEQEVTPVGRVSRNLLQQSNAEDQNQDTRAYQAPAELLELARRQRERAQARPSAKPHSARSGEGKIKRLEVRVPRPSEDEAAPPRLIGESLPPRERPTRRPGRSGEVVESSAPSISVNPASSSDSVNFLDDGEPADSSADDAAPPVARSRPSRALSDLPGAESAPRPPASLRELMQAASDPNAPRSIAAPSEESNSPGVAASERISTTSRPRPYYWALLVVVFIALGFALAKWPALDLLLSR